MKIVEVRTLDMALNTGTFDYEDAEKFGLIELVITGFLVSDSGNRVILAKEVHSTESQCRHLTAVPKCCIISITQLRRGRPVDLPPGKIS